MGRYSSLPPGEGYTAICRLSFASSSPSLVVGRKPFEPWGLCERDAGLEKEVGSERAREVMSSKSDSAISSPVSSRISVAAAPAKVPLSSMPAGSSGKEREPAGRRGCRVRSTCLSVSLEGGLVLG